MSDPAKSGPGAELGAAVTFAAIILGVCAAWHLAVVTTAGVGLTDVSATWRALREFDPIDGLDDGATTTKRGTVLTVFGSYLVGVLVLFLAGAYVIGRVTPSKKPLMSDMDRQRTRSERWARPADVSFLVVDAARSSSPAGNPAGELAGRAVYGQLDGRLVASPLGSSVGVISPTGGGKTSIVVVPTVLRWRGPAVVTSVKSDVLRLTLDQRRRLGPVWIFDPTSSTGLPTSRWSPLAMVTDYSSAMKAAAWICDSSKVANGGDDKAFWEDLGEQLLAPLLLLAARTERTMTDVARWVLNRDEDEINTQLTKLNDPDATANWQGIRGNVEKTKHSIFLTSQRILKSFSHPDVRAAFETRPVASLEANSETGLGEPVAPDSDGLFPFATGVFTPAKLLDSGGTLYVCAPAGDQKDLAPVFETIINQVLREVETRSMFGGGLPIDPRLLLMLDEAANVAPLRQLPSIASKGRGEGVVVMSIWQALEQMDRLYGRAGAEEVRGNHASWCYLPGITSDETLRHLSALIGRDEFDQKSRSVGADGRSSTSYSTHEADVAPISWLRELPSDEMIVIAGRHKPLRVKTRPWYLDDALRVLIPDDVAASFDAAFTSSSTRPASATATTGSKHQNAKSGVRR